MNKLHVIALLFLAIFAPKVYAISPTPTPHPIAPPSPIFSPANAIIGTISDTANALMAQYGYRVRYSGQKFAPEQRLTLAQAQVAAPYLLVCESGNKDGNSCGIDSNGKPSCGRGQFQDWSTFWEPASGIYGNPLNGNDAITMMLWALENGYIQRWSCARITKLIP